MYILLVIKYEDEHSELKKISTDYIKIMLYTTFYQLYTGDIPCCEVVVMANFTDDTAVMAIGTHIEHTTEQLQI